MKTSLQPVCPSDVGTARSCTGQNLDCTAGGDNFGVAVIKVLNCCPYGAGIVMMNEDVAGISGWTLIFHLLDNFVENSQYSMYK